MKSKITSIIKKVVRESRQLGELRTAVTPLDRLRSLVSGATRRQRIGKEFAASKQPEEKSPGLKPRNIKPDEVRRDNKKVNFPDTIKDKEITDKIFNKKDVKESQSNLNESYDSFNIEKPAGYGTFMTAEDMGITIQGAFAHHPSVVKEMYRRKTRRKRKNGVVFTNN